MTKRFASSRAVLAMCTALLGSQALPAFAADAWEPHRPIEIVVPSAAGGGLDLVARTLQNAIVQEKLSSKPITVLNRPGGSGTVGLAYINNHHGDGHYVSVQALPLVTNQITGLSKVGISDVTPLGMFVTEQVVFSVPASSPIKTGKDLIAMLKQNPQNVTIGVSSSPGGQSHDAAALVVKAAGQDPKKLKIVFFDSGGEAVTSLMGGHVTVTATPAGTVIGPSQSGRTRMIAIAGGEREGGALANVPTWKEQGLDVDFTTWRVLVGPKGMSADEIAWWDNVLQKATSSPEWAEAVKRNEWTAAYRNSAQTKQFLDDEAGRLGPLMGELGLARN
ncbi:MAG TPA: tripartite tricarboxylate transporter substrate binding protein [Paraburkholderia sp.]|uniref:tripartite tricarboxylate transporter substrate binding protein n=1 Tax=Paraburkholderia sp. TaxID=1926495 RepID=UPI002B459666|nr:tripartite tricarboxylate transporter substrate binding protein [Paraburkholderia sp.]HKR45410.1 tripartite tricarboxylate transporter substrate binding protein [Paraburkholderia sp.]